MAIIIVNTAALRSSGALSIYRQFIHHLSLYKGNNQFYIFVDPSMDQPAINGVCYIQDSNHSVLHRLWWDYIGLKRWLKNNSIIPTTVISLQNTGVLLHCKQVIYYHQPLPFYDRKWSFLKSSERTMALYKYIYPWFVKLTLTSNTQVVVQIPFIKRGFVKRYKFDEKRVHVMFPDVEKIDADNTKPHTFENGLHHFVYPATNVPYKEHGTLVRALRELQKHNPELVARIRIHLTLSENDCTSLCHYIEKCSLGNQFVFDGIMPHDKLLSFYKSATGLLFPSTIETLGLPLIEAAAFGLPIIASDLEYAHEVMGNYEGVRFVGSYNYEEWAKAIETICIEHQSYQPIKPKESSWKNFFDLIN